MARYGGVLVVEDTGQNPTSVDIFALSRASSVDASIDIGDGWTVEVGFGSRDVLARGGTATDYSDARAAALSYAQRGLDLRSVKGTGDLIIVPVDDEHDAWWLTLQGVVLRYVLIWTTLNFDVPPRL